MSSDLMDIKNRNQTFGQEKRFIYLCRGQIVCYQGQWLHCQPTSLVLAVWQPETIFIAALGECDIYLQIIDSTATTKLSLVSGKDLLVKLGQGEASLLSRALQLAHWLQDHQYCGRCGQKTHLREHDYGLHCHTCKLTQYPRLSPCIIVVVIGPQGLLLGRNANFTTGRYSALAGFVEAGENVENAVHREVKEEVGVEIHNIRYISSQSWAFPHSLMMGFLADYKDGDIQVDGVELDDANWFTAQSLPDLPPPYSIARHLVDLGLEHLENRLSEPLRP